MDLDRTVLLPVALEARSELVGVQDSRLYDGVSSGTTQASWCSLASVADVRRAIAPSYPVCDFAASKDVDDGEGIVRPIASLTRSPCT